jgi:hypothetical protein
VADGVILSHAEGHARGIASNHADVEHIWSRFNLTMEQFRKDVKATMEAAGSGTDTGTTSGTIQYIVQAGAFEKEENANRLAEQLRAAGFEAIVKKV